MKPRLIALLLVMLSLVSCLSSCKSQVERELEKARKATKRAEQAAYEAQAEYDRLTYLLERYEECQALIASLTPGSYEYEQAVTENNRVVRQLIAEFPEFADYVK